MLACWGTCPAVPTHRRKASSQCTPLAHQCCSPGALSPRGTGGEGGRGRSLGGACARGLLLGQRRSEIMMIKTK